ncbi:putative transcriptional regulator of the myo-inositol catabolic operon [Desulfosporosinus sp. I2]|uniref:LacI family DNA-binding transcriptional regulator n=1 Tax=Desulfosporosinus sp. I2 TaxID=1617025 RepID=UPI0005ED6DCB|nr:LacI family DNA-binding transcriptional regulator [Desulfosporosinus sp. I2]KJR44601.1 putative transcriptional regulator of the myo-inositol catabolic operon [Desulfosporosinus sp. I2]
MAVTIYDIAREANVSIATVSKVINNSGRISSPTRDRVHKVIDELDYRPNLLASAMTSKRTYTAGILIPDIGNPFYPDVIRGVEDFARQNNYSVLLCNTDDNLEKQLEYVELLKQKSVDGIIVAAVAASPERLIETLGDSLPTVVLARRIKDPNQQITFPSVVVDNFRGGYLATKHLIENGHSKISLLGESLHIESSQERMRGCIQALEEHFLALHSVEFCTRNLGFEGGYNATINLLKKTSPPTAIFADTDLLAFGGMKAAKELGYRVPDDISFIGFDNTALCTIVDPPLSSIAQPMYELGQRTMEILIGKISGLSVPELTVLDISLVERQSVKRITDV